MAMQAVQWKSLSSSLLYNGLECARDKNNEDDLVHVDHVDLVLVVISGLVLIVESHSGLEHIGVGLQDVFKIGMVPMLIQRPPGGSFFVNLAGVSSLVL